MVVIPDSLRREVVDNIHDADRQTVTVLAVGIDGRESFLYDTHRALHALAPFLVDNTAFGFDFSRVESDVAGPVVKNEQTAVLHRGAGYRNIRDIVDSLVDTGAGVEVITELHTYRFEPCYKVLAREICGAVEAHMLQKVGKTALVVLFENRADFLCYVEIGLSFGIVVMTDKIGEAVGQCARVEGGVERQFRQLLAGGLCL